MKETGMAVSTGWSHKLQVFSVLQWSGGNHMWTIYSQWLLPR